MSELKWVKTTFGELKAGDVFSGSVPDGRSGYDVIFLRNNGRLLEGTFTNNESVHLLVTPEREALGVREVARCPVCKGTMIVPAGFYNQTSGEWSSGGGVEKCRNCNATGIIIIDTIATAALEVKP